VEHLGRVGRYPRGVVLQRRDRVGAEAELLRDRRVERLEVAGRVENDRVGRMCLSDGGHLLVECAFREHLESESDDDEKRQQPGDADRSEHYLRGITHYPEFRRRRFKPFQFRARRI